MLWDFTFVSLQMLICNNSGDKETVQLHECRHMYILYIYIYNHLPSINASVILCIIIGVHFSVGAETLRVVSSLALSASFLKTTMILLRALVLVLCRVVNTAVGFFKNGGCCC